MDDEKLGIHFAHWARKQIEQLPIALTYREFAMGHAVVPESLAYVAEWLVSQLDDRRSPHRGGLDLERARR